jgi:hypothetical protein
MFGPQFIAKLAMNPETRPYLEDQSFRTMLDTVAANPSMLSVYINDPRFAKALEVGFGINFASGQDTEDGPGLSAATGARDVPSKATKPPEPEPEPEPEVELTEEEKSEKEAKEKAIKVRLAMQFGTYDCMVPLAKFCVALIRLGGTGNREISSMSIEHLSCERQQQNSSSFEFV